MGQLHTLTVKVEKLRFRDAMHESKRDQAGPDMWWYSDHPSEQAPDAKLVTMPPGKELAWYGVTLSVENPHILAALAMEMRQRQIKRQEDGDTYVHLVWSVEGLTLSVVFHDDQHDLMEGFVKFWNGREVVWSNGGGIKYFE